MKEKYDVIIIGAGIAGIETARRLAGSHLSLLLIDNKKIIGEKVCAHGITSNDLEFIPEKYHIFPFQKANIIYGRRKRTFPKNGNLISAIDRKKFLNDRVKDLEQNKNIDISLGTAVSGIKKNHIFLNEGKIGFKYLVGADGANSKVRKFLNIPSKRLEIGLQYLLPRKKDDEFSIFLDSGLFGTGYVWVFPNKDFTSVGCGSDKKVITSKKLRKNFEKWLKENNFDVSEATFQAALINSDYRGYRFGNIFLVGDAAGLTSAITGKGIYPAFLSAEQVANEIVGVNNEENLIENWLSLKRRQEFFMFFLRGKLRKKIFFSLGMIMINLLEKRILKYL